MTTREKARRYFDGGLNCAESVCKAVVEDFDGSTDAVPRMATAFGGGVGSTHQEMCGALSGAMLALGYMMGRNSAQESNEQIKMCAAEMRAWFIDQFANSMCQDIRDRQETTTFPSCADIVEQTAEHLCKDLMKKGFRPVSI